MGRLENILSYSSDVILTEIITEARKQAKSHRGACSFVWNPCWLTGFLTDVTICIEDRYIWMLQQGFLRRKEEWILSDYSRNHSLIAQYRSFLQKLNVAIDDLPEGVTAMVEECMLDERISKKPMGLGSEAIVTITCTVTVSVSDAFIRQL